MWGPQVHESAFATCLARHNTYLQECTGLRDPSYPFYVHDLKLLLQRFAEERSFSEDSGGGGRQSNAHLIPYIMHMALYVINTTRSLAREEKNLNNFLDVAKEKWVENSFESEGAQYWSVMSTHLWSPDRWKAARTRFLERLIITAHARSTLPIGAKTVTDKKVKEYSVYKPYLIFFGLVDGIYQNLLKKVNQKEEDWTRCLADHIRHNDRPMLEGCDRLLSIYEEEMLPCESFTEYCDVIGMLEEIPEPDKFLSDLLESMPAAQPAN